MKITQIVLMAIALAALNGCATKNFVVPPEGTVVLGKTTTEEVKRLAGGLPMTTGEEKIVNGEKLKDFGYRVVIRSSVWDFLIPERNLIYYTLNDVVVSEAYDSIIEGEETKYDLNKIPLLEIGQTEAEVIALMGKPVYRAIYPFAKDKEDRVIGWTYFSHLVRLTLDKDGKVKEILYFFDNKEKLRKPNTTQAN